MPFRFDKIANPYPLSRNTIYAKNGMVATSQPLASQAGLEMLKRGGNAVDAAIATAACLTVVEPTSCGIGGDAFAIVWMKDAMYGLNSSGPSPKSISIDAVKAAGHETMPARGWTPVTVPGVPGAWAALSKRFGKLSLSECLAPAIRYAGEGYPLSPLLARMWKEQFNIFKDNFADKPEFAEWFKTFAPKGRAPEIGEMWSSPNHAATLTEIGETCAESFYRGRLADAIAAASAAHGGYLAKSDLEGYAPEWVEPASIRYRDYDVWEIPPNGQGIVPLIALNVLKGYDFRARDDIETFHKQFEAMKLAFTAGRQEITDPAYMRVSVKDLLSDAYAATLRKHIRDMASEPIAVKPSPGGTVYLAAADGDGNMVSYIQSNFMEFGSGMVVPGTGICMQNRGFEFRLDPGHVNHLAGGKKTYHTIIPGFLTLDGKAIGPFGVMGVYMQPQGHVQVIMNTIDFNLNPQAALDAPRWQWREGKKFRVESRFPSHIVQELARRGHLVETTADSIAFGRGQIIWRDPDTGALAGGTESRTDGAIASR